MLSTPFITGLVSSGFFSIPVGARQFQVAIVSGSAYINNVQFLAGQTLPMSMPDSKTILGAALVVAVSGAGVNKVTAFWTT